MNSAYEWVNKRTRPAKPNNKTMKYRVKTRQLRSFDIGDIVEKRNGGYWLVTDNKNHCISLPAGMVENSRWFEPVEEVQEGQYWEDDYGNIGRVQVVYESDVEIKSIDEEAVNTYDKSFFIDRARKLSTPEIEQALKKEAKRRGLAPGNKVKTPCGFEYTLSGNPYEYKYKADLDRLYSSGVLIYDNGDFAEPIDQTPNIEINGNKVEFNDHPKVGCTTIKKKVFIEQAKTIARHGVRIHRKGEDITDQILAIASHYGYDTDLSNTIGETVTIEGSVDGSITWGFSSENMWNNND